jgi:hypothetical protein
MKTEIRVNNNCDMERTGVLGWFLGIQINT